MKEIDVENDDGSITMTLRFYSDGSYVIYYYTEEMPLDETFLIDELSEEDFLLRMIGVM